MTYPKCNAVMEEGFLAGPKLVEWIEGVLEKEKSVLFEVHAVTGSACLSKRSVV